MRVGDVLRATARERPADRVAEHREDEPERRRGRCVEREHRVRGVPGEEGAGALAVEARAREARRRAERATARTAPSRAGAAADGAAASVPSTIASEASHERPEEAPPGVPVHSQPGRGLLDRALEHDCRPVVERVRERRRRMDPLDAVLGQRHGAHERRGDPERVDRGAGVVQEARERQLLGAQAAADRVAALDDEHRATGPREHDRRREPVRPRSDDDRVVHPGDGTPYFPGLSMCSVERIATELRTFFACDHCRLRSTQVTVVRHLGAARPEMRRRGSRASAPRTGSPPVAAHREAHLARAGPAPASAPAPGRRSRRPPRAS